MSIVELLAILATMLVSLAALDLLARRLRDRQPDRPPGQPRAEPIVSEGGAWAGRSEREQVQAIAEGSTPKRELIDGEVQPWIER